MATLRTFEDELFPIKDRWEYALGNVASDAKHVGPEFKDRFAFVAPQLYRGYKDTPWRVRVGIMNLMLPVGCNAECRDICYTDIAHWRRQTEHLTSRQLFKILEQFFADLEGRVIRIVGDGEPTLWRGFPRLCEWAEDSMIDLVVFTNGVRLSPSARAAFRYECVNFYVKLWSENPAKQNQLVRPRTPYRYVNGELGPAPAPFYELYAIDPKRVGFQVMVSTLNEVDARAIINGPKSTVPLFVEPFIPEGAGRGYTDFLVADFPFTKTCSQPPRASYLAVVNSRGHLQAGTFVPEPSVSVRDGNFANVWKQQFVRDPHFFAARYTGGCFCERMRAG